MTRIVGELKATGLQALKTVIVFQWGSRCTFVASSRKHFVKLANSFRILHRKVYELKRWLLYLEALESFRQEEFICQGELSRNNEFLVVIVIIVIFGKN